MGADTDKRDNRNAIDRFFDAADDLLDSTIPEGKIGYTVLLSGEDEGEGSGGGTRGRTMVWHYALYKVGTPCGIPLVSTRDWHAKVPGGYVLFCCKCLRKCRTELENAG